MITLWRVCTKSGLALYGSLEKQKCLSYIQQATEKNGDPQYANRVLQLEKLQVGQCGECAVFGKQLLCDRGGDSHAKDWGCMNFHTPQQK